MPTPGLSMVGFMERSQALDYLVQVCAPPDPSPQALEQAWQDAQARLGPPTANAGQPQIQPIPQQHAGYLTAVQQHPRFPNSLEGMAWSFQLVEIDPILAFQFHVNTARTDALCGSVTSPPSMDELLTRCLPLQIEDVPFQISVQPNSLLLASPSLNLRAFSFGQVGVDPAQNLLAYGLVVGPAFPLLQVIRFDGRCYLRNGYHRIYGLKKKGALRVPCLFFEATDYKQVGAPGGRATFDKSLLDSANPPTCAHLIDARGYPVHLRNQTRAIHLTWSDHVLAEP